MEICPLVLHASAFRVQFDREKDRFTHQLIRSNGTCLMASVSGSNDSPWPPDPPLQQLVMEDIAANGNTAALGVGMSGQGHWSLAAQPIALPRPGIQFDWACKIHRKADRLSSTYQIDSGIALAPSSPEDASLQSDKRITLRSLDGLVLRIEVNLGRIEWDANERILRILPDGSFNKPGTYRWCYTVVVE